ncbi:leukocyte antigen CD37 isoform X2 [Electrophorus electricus]|uniref:leukocyte antigen CD37 isoform X2 n=1 Tax=Electrophorus electricus TaxID=8005 RepID=UPI0015D071C5|nr:leukocyte antigen CD37 isoform X2 [Electrophorus electricus]
MMNILESNMASEFCLSITKYFLFLFNIIFLFLGSTLLSLGLWIKLSKTNFLLPDPHYISLPLFSYMLITGGSVVVLLGFFGSMGALKGVKCMLGFYLFLLILLFTAQIVCAVLLFTQWSSFKEVLEDHVVQLIKTFGKNDSSLQDFERSFQVIQHEAQCCGWHGIDDWGHTKPDCSCWYQTNATANNTDHSHFSDPCPCGPHPPSNFTCAHYNQGCQNIITNWLDEHFLIIIGVTLAIAVVEFLQWVCLVTFCCLNNNCRCCPLRKSHGSQVQLSRYVVRSFRCFCINGGPGITS